MEHAAQERFPLVAGVAVLATGVFAGWVGLGVGGEAVVRYVDDLATVLAALAATLLCVGAARRHAQPMRRFWSLLAGASACWMLAEIVWAAYELVLHAEVPIPSWADVGYLIAVPLAIAALITHPATRQGNAQRARSLLDGLVLATSLLFLSWTLVLGPLWRSSDLSTSGGVIGLAYPFSDVVIVFFIVLAVRGMTGRNRLSLWCLLAGLLAMALSDTGYAYLTQVQSYGTGQLIDTGWFAAYLGIALSAYSSRGGKVLAAQVDHSQPTLASLVIPFFPVLLALGVFGVQTRLGHQPDRAAWAMTLALVVLVLSRQALLLLDVARSKPKTDAILPSGLPTWRSESVSGPR
jgi:hypothetical protein